MKKIQKSIQTSCWQSSFCENCSVQQSAALAFHCISQLLWNGSPHIGYHCHTTTIIMCCYQCLMIFCTLSALTAYITYLHTVVWKVIESWKLKTNHHLQCKASLPHQHICKAMHVYVTHAWLYKDADAYTQARIEWMHEWFMLVIAPAPWKAAWWCHTGSCTDRKFLRRFEKP